MKKFLFILMSILLVLNVNADTPRVSLFSTTVDWSAVTGLSLYQYNGNIFGKNSDLVKQGLVLYYLDAFPCYGAADSVRVWVGKDGKVDGNLRLICIHEPDEIKFAWRNAKSDAIQDKTDGLLVCPVSSKGREINIDISKCTRGKSWDEYK